MSKAGNKDIMHSINISDEDIIDAMRDIPGYLDITPGDFRELYRIAYRHAVSKIFDSVKAKQIMTKDAIYVDPETPLTETAQLMAEKFISGLPVVTKDRKVAGIISEKDFLARMGAKDTGTFMGVVAECLKGKGCVAVDIRGRTAKDIMSAPAITVKEETSVRDILNCLTEKNINRVPVVDEKECLSGIISRANIIRASLLHAVPVSES